MAHIRMALKSTNVRTFFAGLLPGVVTRLAIWTFFRSPQPEPGPYEERRALAQARHGLVQVAGHRIATWSWGEGPQVLLVHGWGGRGGQLHHLVPPLVAAGFSVLAFDAPGHGRSSGRSTHVPEMAAVLQAVAGTEPLHTVIAHSLGTAAAALAVRDRANPPALVLISPVVEPAAFLLAHLQKTGLTGQGLAQAEALAAARLGRPSSDLALIPNLRRFPQPVLVVHDRGDRIVPSAHAQTLLTALPDVRMLETEGLGHYRILADPDVIARVVAFVQQPAASAV